MLLQICEVLLISVKTKWAFPLCSFLFCRSPLWRMENRLWSSFPCQSPGWIRALWFPTARGEPSARAVKSQGRQPARRPSQGGEGPSRRRSPRRRRSAVPNVSASPLMQTPSTFTPGPCSHSRSLWWTWSTGWRTRCELEGSWSLQMAAIQDCIYNILLEHCRLDPGKRVQPEQSAEGIKRYDLWICKWAYYWRRWWVHEVLTGLCFMKNKQRCSV